MKKLLFLITVCLVIVSCGVQRKSGCVNERDVWRHDKKQFHVYYIKEGSTIAKANELQRATLVSVNRSMKRAGQFRHLFVTDRGDTIVDYLNIRLCVGSCYEVKNI